MLVDCHAHLTAADFATDRDLVLARAGTAGVAAVLVVGEDLADDERVLALAAAPPAPGAPRLLPCLGLHPDRFADAAAPPSRAAIDATLALVRAHAGVLAGIGEIGLDQWAVKDPARRAAAEELLAAFAALGRELDLTLNVHSRSAGERTLDVLRAAGAGRVLMHAFDGRASLAVRAADDGTVFSIPPSVVRSPQKQKLVRRLPLEALVLESDAPVLGPTPGERNEPANLALTRDYLAAAHGVSAERVAEMTTATAWRLFPRLAAALG